MRVGQGKRARRNAINHEGVHLQLGEGASHAVAIDDGQAQLQGGHQRTQRVATTDLADDDGVHGLAQVGFHGADGTHDLAPFLQFLVADCGRAHATDRADQGIVWHIVGADDGQGFAAPAQFVVQAQTVEIGAAAPTRAEYARADGDGVGVVEGYGLHCFFIFSIETQK